MALHTTMLNLVTGALTLNFILLDSGVRALSLSPLLRLSSLGPTATEMHGTQRSCLTHANNDEVDIKATNNVFLPRRHVLASSLLSMGGVSIGMSAQPAVAASAPPGRSGIDVGGGFDLFSEPDLASPDVLYPPSLLGPWICQRVVTSVEGDAFQAETAWRSLGGTGDLSKKSVETYKTRYIEPIAGAKSSKGYFYNGEVVKGVVLDRSYEMYSRIGGGDGKAEWDVVKPDILRYDRASGGSGVTELAVVQRGVETPSDKGFGFNELVRITSTDFGGGKQFLGGVGNVRVERCARVQRRYRRAFDDSGNRVVEGLEIMKTYRVLDGVAGTEMPTSTVKSMIRMTRPPSAPV